MAETLIITGKTVEAALEAALKKLEKRRDQVSFTVLEEASKGIFGFLSKDAKIRVTVKEEQTAAQTPLDEEKRAAEEENPAAVEAIESAEKSEERRESLLPMEEDVGIVTEKAKAFLQKIFHSMQVETTLDVEMVAQGQRLTIKGEDVAILIGKRGQTLDALEYLTNLAANHGRNDGRVHIILDAEDYRARREEALKNLAERLAMRAVKSRKDVRLEPMNRYERKIIHMVLQGREDVHTISAGEDPYRYIVIVPNNKRMRSYRNSRREETS